MQCGAEEPKWAFYDTQKVINNVGHGGGKRVFLGHPRVIDNVGQI